MELLVHRLLKLALDLARAALGALTFLRELLQTTPPALQALLEDQQLTLDLLQFRFDAGELVFLFPTAGLEGLDRRTHILDGGAGLRQLGVLTRTLYPEHLDALLQFGELLPEGYRLVVGPNDLQRFQLPENALVPPGLSHLAGETANLVSDLVDDVFHAQQIAFGEVELAQGFLALCLVPHHA